MLPITGFLLSSIFRLAKSLVTIRERLVENRRGTAMGINGYSGRMRSQTPAV